MNNICVWLVSIGVFIFGISIISYSSASPDLTSIGGGLTYAKTTSGGNTIYTFTAGTGTVTV